MSLVNLQGVLKAGLSSVGNTNTKQYKYESNKTTCWTLFFSLCVLATICWKMEDQFIFVKLIINAGDQFMTYFQHNSSKVLWKVSHNPSSHCHNKTLHLSRVSSWADSSLCYSVRSLGRTQEACRTLYSLNDPSTFFVFWLLPSS